MSPVCSDGFALNLCQWCIWGTDELVRIGVERSEVKIPVVEGRVHYSFEFM